MAPYSGLFIRHQMGDTPTSMGKGWSASPDIILNGTTPAANPAAFITPTGYLQDYGSTLYVEQANNVYVRALNTSSGQITSRIWLYYIPSNLVLWTQNWQTRGITVGAADADLNYTSLSSMTTNEIVVTNPPFIVKPPAPDPNQHFCMAAIAENPPLSNPPVSPIPSGSMGTFEQLVQFILDHPNMGWRNTNDVVQNIPTFQQVVPIENAPEGGQINIGIQCKNMTSGYFSFTVPGPDQDNTIIVPQTQITNPSTQLTIPVTWPAGWPGTSITINYYADPQVKVPPPPGATISSLTIIPSDQVVNRLFKGSETDFIRRHGMPDQFLAWDSPARTVLKPIYAHVIGSNPVRFVSPTDNVVSAF